MKIISVSDQVSVLACQLKIPNTRSVSERDQNLAILQEKVADSLVKERVDLVVLPELSSIEYSSQSFRRLDELAETVEGPSYSTWRSISREFNTHVVYGFPRRSADGYKISLAVTGPDGNLLGHYDKIFLAHYGNSTENEFYEAGDGLFEFEINGICFGLILCSDIRIPEIARSLTLDHGVDAILHPSAYGRDMSFYSWHHFAVTRALENQIYLLSLNRAGKDFGGSIFCPPWIDENHLPVVFNDHEEQVLKLSIERSEIESVRENIPFLKDRLENNGMRLA